MSASDDSPKRLLIADTETPGAEIVLSDGLGQVVARAVNRLEDEFDPGLYKLRFRVGDQVKDMLIELPPGQGAFQVETPRLPFETAAPITRRGRTPSPNSERARALSLSTPDRHGDGSQLLLFVDTPEDNIPPPVEVLRFGGEPIAHVAANSAADPFAGCHLGLDPGSYLLRWGNIEQSVVTCPGWQTQLYVEGVAKDQPDFSQAAILMCRSGLGFDPDNAGARSTEVARRALETGRTRAADDAGLANSVLEDGFDNPMLGLLTAHLMLLTGKPDLAKLARLVHRLDRLVSGHPDVQSLYHALQNPSAATVTFPEPPMLRSSWQQILAADSQTIPAVPSGSYSARIAGSLWGDGAWLSWTTPPPPDLAAGSGSMLESLVEFIGLVSSGRLPSELVSKTDLTPAERALLSYADNLVGQADLARVITAAIDKSSRLGMFLPAFRKIVPSSFEKDANRRIETSKTPELLSSSIGLPFASLADAAQSLLQKISSDPKLVPSNSGGLDVVARGFHVISNVLRKM